MREFDKLKELVNDISDKFEKINEIVSDLSEYGFTTIGMHGFDKDKTVVIRMQELIDRVVSLEKYRHEFEEAKDYEKRVKILSVADAEKTNQIEHDLKTAKTVFEKIWDKIYGFESNLKWIHVRIDEAKEGVAAVKGTLFKNNVHKLNEQIGSLKEDIAAIHRRDGEQNIHYRNLKIGQFDLTAHIGKLLNQMDKLTDRISVLEARANEVVTKFDNIWDRVLKLEERI